MPEPDPHEPNTISVTIKGDEPGGKFNDAKKPGTWIVFHGSPARVAEQICEVFNLELGDRPLYDLVNEATDLFKSAANVSTGLGGRVLSAGQQAAPAAPAASGGGDVLAQAAAAVQQGGSAPAAQGPAADPILAALEGAKTVAEVQQIWAENQAQFAANAEYMNAYRDRGRALS